MMIIGGSTLLWNNLHFAQNKGGEGALHSYCNFLWNYGQDVESDCPNLGQ